MRNKTFLIAGVLIAIVLVVVFLLLRGGGYGLPSSQPVPTTGTTRVEERVVIPEEMTEEEREIVVEGDEYSFSPASISVGRRERIMLTFRNTGQLPHNLIIDELGVATRTILGGEADTVEFIAETGGTFPFYCSVGNHRSLGMEGEMEVR